VPPWQTILKEYWETKGWVDGIPTRDKIIELDLEGLGPKKALRFECKEYLEVL